MDLKPRDSKEDGIEAIVRNKDSLNEHNIAL